MHETQVACFPMSADQENDADVWGIMGASLTLNMSNIPFNTLLAGVRLGRVQGNWILNPTFQQLEYSDVDIVVVGDKAGHFGRGTVGEGTDTDDLTLPGAQPELLDAVIATGTPTVVVLVNGRPPAIPSLPERTASIVEAWFTAT